MGLYAVLKPFPRNEKGGGKVTIRPGVKIKIELRSEAEELLRGGFITKDLSVAGPLAGIPRTESDNRPARIPTFSPEQVETIRVLAKKCGMPYEGAEHQILARMTDKTTTADQAIAIFSRIQGIVSAKELIEEAAEALGEPEAELQAEVFELAKEFKLSIADTIKRLTLARRAKRPAKDVLAMIRDEVQSKSLTPQQVIASIEKDIAAEAEPKAAPDVKAAQDDRKEKRNQKRGR